MKTILMAFVLIGSSLTYAAVSEDILARHREIVGKDNCDADLEPQATEYQLNSTQKLVLIPCGAGAYNIGSLGYIATKIGDNNYLNQVIVLQKGEGLEGTTDLVNADYDPKTKIISTFAKGRGIGDCGQSSQSKLSIDESSVLVKTIQIRSKDKCDGKMTTWPVVFKQ